MLKIVKFIIAKLVAKAINANYSIFVLNSCSGFYNSHFI